MKPAAAAAASGAQAMISRYPNYMILWSCNGATFCHKVMYNGSDPSTHIADFSATTGAWTQVTGRYDGSRLRAYVAGTMTGEEVTSDAPMATAYTAKIGTRMDLAGYYDGGIDEVRISKIARSDDYLRAQARSTTDTYVTYGGQESN